jgi:hypothetical protein
VCVFVSACVYVCTSGNNFVGSDECFRAACYVLTRVWVYVCACESVGESVCLRECGCTYVHVCMRALVSVCVRTDREDIDAHTKKTNARISVTSVLWPCHHQPTLPSLEQHPCHVHRMHTQIHAQGHQAVVGTH